MSADSIRYLLNSKVLVSSALDSTGKNGSQQTKLSVSPIDNNLKYKSYFIESVQILYIVIV